jgi:hypothetical protein
VSLHDLVANLIGAINPQMTCQWYKNTGIVTAIGGVVAQSYSPAVPIQCQVQQLTAADIKHMQDLNQSGITRKVWCDQILTGIDRAAGLGGDRLVLPDGTIWLVVQVVEVWHDWCSATICKQVS